MIAVLLEPLPSTEEADELGSDVVSTIVLDSESSVEATLAALWVDVESTPVAVTVSEDTGSSPKLQALRRLEPPQNCVRSP